MFDFSLPAAEANMTEKQIVNCIGVCSWCLHASDPAELIARVRETGLGTIQLGLIPLLEERVWADAGKQLEDAGIAVASGMVGAFGEDYSTLETIARTGGIVPDEYWEANWRRFEQGAALAERMGLDMVSFHAGFIPSASEPGYDKVAQRVAQIADMFGNYGVDAILETGQETADDLLALLRDLNHPGLGVNFDPGNMILYGKGDPVEAIAKLIAKVRQIHLKDAKHTTKPGTWGTEMVLDEGDVDWPKFIDVLVGHDYAGDLIIERERGENGVADILTSKRVIGELLGDRAG